MTASKFRGKDMEKNIGFIGVGAMGGPIAARMVERGIQILAYDTDPKNLALAVRKGCTAATSNRQIFDECEIAFACLPTIDICKAVALGPDGAVSGKQVKIYIETSTIGAKAAGEIEAGLAQHGITLVDSPVVGAMTALAAGTLGVLASCPREAFERVKPLLDTYAGRLFYLGEKAGMGQVGKVMSNSVTYASLLATCEALAMGMKGGIDMETALGIINQGSGANFFSQRMVPNFILKGIFSGTGAMEIGLKDVSLFLEAAEHIGAGTPVADAIHSIQEKVVASGPAGRDTMEYIHYFTDLARMPRYVGNSNGKE